MPDSKHEAYPKAIRRLNPRQREALDESGNTVLLAGPGSGKTATLVLKIAKLLEEIPSPRGVACITYGTEAAKEFERRLKALGIRRSGRLFTGTVHAFCLARVLRPYSRRLPAELRSVAQYEVASDKEIARAREKGLEAAGVNESEQWWATKISAYRRVVLVEPSRSGEFDDRLPVIAEAYERFLRSTKRIDFDDIVNMSLRLIAADEYVRRSLAAKFPWLVVDEYQDLGLALHRIVLALMEGVGVRVFAVGDPDQSIYGFTGARPEYLDALSKRDDVTCVRLELNYRCGQNIIDASLHVLQADEGRRFQAADADAAEQGEIYFHHCAEGLERQAAVCVERIQELIGEGVLPGEIGIAMKRNGDLAAFGKCLDGKKVPFRVAKAPVYKATALTIWLEEVAAWCAGGWKTGEPRFGDLYQVWERVLIECRRESRSNRDLVGRTALFQALVPLRHRKMEVKEWSGRLDRALRLSELGEDISRVPLRMRHDVRELKIMTKWLSTSHQSLEDFSGMSEDKVVLQTIHGSKGLEYAAMFIAAMEDGVLPAWNDNAKEARRVFYVALTRAKREVHLLWSGFWYTAEGKLRRKGPSVFLVDLKRRLNAAATK